LARTGSFSSLCHVGSLGFLLIFRPTALVPARAALSLRYRVLFFSLDSAAEDPVPPYVLPTPLPVPEKLSNATSSTPQRMFPVLFFRPFFFSPRPPGRAGGPYPPPTLPKTPRLPGGSFPPVLGETVDPFLFHSFTREATLSHKRKELFFFSLPQSEPVPRVFSPCFFFKTKQSETPPLFPFPSENLSRPGTHPAFPCAPPRRSLPPLSSPPGPSGEGNAPRLLVG